MKPARDDRIRLGALAIGALAVRRVTHLIAAEDGPADVIATARARVGDTLLGELMDCFNCLSVWVAAGVAPVVTRRARDLPLTWLALSGAACLLERVGTAGEPVVDLTAFDQGETDAVLPAEENRPQDRR